MAAYTLTLAALSASELDEVVELLRTELGGSTLEKIKVTVDD